MDKLNPVDLEEIIEKFEKAFIPKERLEILKSLQDVNLLNIQQISTVLKKDPILTSEVLKLANSSFFGFPRKIETIEHAIILLGTNVIKSLTFSMTYSETQTKLPKSKQELFIKVVQEHSLKISEIVNPKIENLSRNESSSIKTGIILHDIGKTVIIFLIPKDQLNEWKDLTGKEWFERERKSFGFTHIDVNKVLAEKWNFPPLLIRIMTEHHNPESKDREVSIIYKAHEEAGIFKL